MRFLGPVAAALFLATPASALPMENHFGTGQTSGCFSRSYSTEHLRKNPRQRVVSISIGFSPRQEYAAEYGPIQFSIDARFRGNLGSGGAEAYCAPNGGGYRCAVEGDGGHFTLSASNGRLRLAVSGRLVLETDTGFVDFMEGDDKVFLLDKKPGRC